MTLLATWAPSAAPFEVYAIAAFANTQEDTIVVQSADSTGAQGQVPTGQECVLELCSSADVYIRSTTAVGGFLIPAGRTAQIRFPAGTRNPTTIFVQGVTATGNLTARKV